MKAKIKTGKNLPKRPNLMEFWETVKEENGKKYGGVNYAKFAFAIEDYADKLEKIIEGEKLN